ESDNGAFKKSFAKVDAKVDAIQKCPVPNAVQWTEECQKAFNQLKATLMSDPVLRAPDFDKPFRVTTDASKRGVGAVLMQEGPDQEFHPVVFLSKKLSERESNWSVSEKECYAIVYALENYAHMFGDSVSTCKPTMLRYSGFILPREITKNLFGGA
ncbi:unnamed protein product, partial [Caretta caretta]